MLARNLALIILTLTTLAGAQQPAAQMPDPQAMQLQVQQIMQQRPREAEAAARAFLILVAPELVDGLDSLRMQASSSDNQPLIIVDGQVVSDQPIGVVRGQEISRSSLQDHYWMEVAQLTVQFDMVQKLTRRDSVRAHLVGRMFGLEANARAQQRTYRFASDASRPPIRKRLETLISQHFDLEDQLRALEIADIERRLADVRAESQRRRDNRAEFIRFAVDDIVRDAIRPR